MRGRGSGDRERSEWREATIDEMVADIENVEPLVLDPAREVAPLVSFRGPETLDAKAEAHPPTLCRCGATLVVARWGRVRSKKGGS